jgi:hypothetical protein
MNGVRSWPTCKLTPHHRLLEPVETGKIGLRQELVVCRAAMPLEGLD